MITRAWGNRVLRHLTTPTYVIRMGQFRFGKEAQIKWLNILREACYETIQETDDILKELEETDG